MRKIWIISILLLLACNISFAAGNVRQRKLTEHGKNFLDKFIPQVMAANYKVSQKRRQLVAIKEYFQHTGNLSDESRRFLMQTADEYELHYEIDYENFHASALEAMNALAERVDVIPVKMVIAQAILETGWGRSKAAQATNNYFGITHRASHGRLVTSDGVTNYYLKPYRSLEEGIAGYIHLLNTKRSYKKLRDIRATCRKNNAMLRAIDLTPGLIKYSELREVYIAKVNNVILRYLTNDVTYYVSR